MDTQLKKGILEICVLAELNRGDSYGYKIEKDLDGWVKLSESALYHILKRHELSGCVTSKSIEHEGRLRKVYSITDNGVKRLSAFKDEWQDMTKAFKFIEGGVSE